MTAEKMAAWRAEYERRQNVYLVGQLEYERRAHRRRLTLVYLLAVIGSALAFSAGFLAHLILIGGR